MSREAELIQENETLKSQIKQYEDQFSFLMSEMEVKENLQSYFSMDVLKEANDPQLFQNKKVNATVMFSDIRGFTQLTEKIGVDNLIQLLNEYYSIMINTIVSNKGTVDKLIGDAILAVFGVPIAGSSDATASLRSAFLMFEELNNLNKRWLESDILDKPLKIGIGINTGKVIAGKLGGQNHQSYTILGDTVNSASRLERATKQTDIHGQIIISESTWQEIQRSNDTDKFPKPLKYRLNLRGVREPMIVRVFKGVAD